MGPLFSCCFLLPMRVTGISSLYDGYIIHVHVNDYGILAVFFNMSYIWSAVTAQSLGFGKIV